jgi:hypothetical protein
MSGYSKDNLNYLKVERSELDADQSDKQNQFSHFKVPFYSMIEMVQMLFIGILELHVCTSNPLC